MFFLNFICISLIGKVLTDFTQLDPDILRTTPEMIESRGFLSETYHAITEDGYRLTVFRMRNPFITTPCKPVILWHGDGMTSDSWFMSRSGQLNSNGMYSEDEGSVINDCKGNITNTLGFTLSACGYDVWLPNSRGNLYSDQNVYLDISDPEFFNYTLTERALYDIPAVVSLVLNQTKRGYSAATSQMWALLSLRPEFERKIQMFISIGTILGHVHSNSQLIQDLSAYLEPLVRPVIGSLGFDRYTAQNISIILSRNRPFSDAIAFLWETIFNSDLEQLDFERFPLYFGKILTRAPYRAYLAQLVTQGQHGFRMFDYGPENNTVIYHQTQPPYYPLERIRSTNIAIIYGQKDITSVEDLNIVRNRLTVPLLAFKRIAWPKWNHFDNMWAIQANIYLNPYIISLLNSMP